jgi:hypothetical protein
MRTPCSSCCCLPSLSHSSLSKQTQESTLHPLPPLLLSEMLPSSTYLPTKHGDARGNLKSGTNLSPTLDFDSGRRKSWNEPTAEQEQCGSLLLGRLKRISILVMRNEGERGREECLGTSAAVWHHHLAPGILDLNGLGRQLGEQPGVWCGGVCEF